MEVASAMCTETALTVAARIDLSSPPLTSVSADVQATLRTAPVWPRNHSSWAPATTSITRTLPSAPVAATRLPLGSAASPRTAEGSVITGPTAPLARVQLRTVLSSPAAMTRSLVRATARTGLA